MIERVLAIILAVVFLMSGANKLTDSISKDTHQFLVTESGKWAPLYDVPAALMLKAIGLTEVLAAVLLLTPLVRLGAAVLTIVMVGAVYTHIALGDAFVHAIPAAVLGLLSAVLFRLYSKPQPKKKAN